MDPRPGTTRSTFVGRADELAAVQALLERAGAGTSGAMLITGDAGVGKSALVERGCSHARSSTVVLTGMCLPMTEMTVPCLALTSALRSAGPGITPPAGLMAAGGAPTPIPVAFDQWLTDLCRDRPVVLTIDDLQWADESTLDVLMYVLAGPADRRLTVIATIRSGVAREGSPLHHWLADVRRLPRIEQMGLDTLDRAMTAEQLTSLLGASPHQTLVEDVFAHTRGNAYLNRLLVKDLASNARELPADLPADLSTAVLQSWWRLPGPSREVTRALAVGGEPLTALDLTAASVGHFGTADVRSSLRAAVEAGILDVARNGRYWFHHPMIAEVLEQTLTDEERVRWHSAFADRAEQRMAEAPPPSLDLLIAAADHHDRAGHLPEAYRWSLRAAESAGGTPEELRLLQRAVDLRPSLPDSDDDERGLLRRMVSAAAAAGAFREELRAVDMLLGSIEKGEEPLLTAELLVRRARLRLLTGQDFLSEGDVRTAVALTTAADPASWQHACALAALVRIASWQDDSEIETLADRALAVARKTGHPLALSSALGAMAMVPRTGGPHDGRRMVEEAVAAAVAAGDHYTVVSAMIENVNEAVWAPRFKATRLSRERDRLTALGAPHSYSALLSAIEADLWLTIGDWRACQDRLRETLGSDPGPFADVHARLTGARLAAWQGRSTEAQDHLDRADELFRDGSQYLAFAFDVTRAIVSLATGDSESAIAAALAGARSSGSLPDKCEWLLPLAARALADMAQGERDSGHDPFPQLLRLNELRERSPDVLLDLGGDRRAPHVLAMADLYEAEVGRAELLPDNGEQWIRASDSCHVATLAWEEAYACWRGAESLLAHRRQSREEGALILRRGLLLATDLRAEPIRQALEALAASARISGTRVDTPPEADLVELPGLTTREREILAHVVAGRTYREIARALVISEKTVSSHISNLLRKTGADNRVDLARLATRAAPRPLPLDAGVGR